MTSLKQEPIFYTYADLGHYYGWLVGRLADLETLNSKPTKVWTLHQEEHSRLSATVSFIEAIELLAETDGNMQHTLAELAVYEIQRLDRELAELHDVFDEMPEPEDGPPQEGTVQ